MQISTQEVMKALQRAAQRDPSRSPNSLPDADSVEELAKKYGVDAREIAAVVEAVRMAEDDPWRERRVRDLKVLVDAGAYRVDADQIVEMAERRAAADRAMDG